MLVGVCHLTGFKAQVDEVFLLRAGQDAAENGKIALLVLLAHEGDGLAEGGQNFAAGRNVAPRTAVILGAVRRILRRSSPISFDVIKVTSFIQDCVVKV